MIGMLQAYLMEIYLVNQNHINALASNTIVARYFNGEILLSIP